MSGGAYWYCSEQALYWYCTDRLPLDIHSTEDDQYAPFNFSRFFFRKKRKTNLNFVKMVPSGKAHEKHAARA
jgi:hypothetical protein